ncbi:hypothetical protein LWI28_001357 [Acer negundo]|uniref:Polymerase nucleotidyl transferase domain-containing protein n=1 Tax=Acer negundo TaxID=4023 RepID=A0AAD5NHI1_ACENE|nr:hypothetical protein LWI28_001357 [Acer negundo]
MDGHEGRAQPSGFYFNGLLPSEADSSTRVLDRGRWSRAEKRVAELIACIQPNKHSEIQRNAIESYMRRLITKCFPCQSVGPVDVALHIITAAPSSPIFYGLSRNEEQKIIFSFIIFWLSSEFLLIFFVPQVHAYGSVPLQTYLPDGDIDLTAFSKNQDLKWYDILKEVLENERERENAEFCLKDVEIIHAKVQIVKCIVENIAVDISFNQLGGLCALCFLEEVDNLINKNHLFKRSILLIKAWCYYERHILGAQHSFISTYALETLVLYIFHAFDNSLAGPLEVLYRFLEFFSKFDWDNFYVSLWGPVPRSSIPDMAAAVPPRRDGQELLLSKSVYECIAAYTVLPLGQGNLNFKPKRFNIMDPLLTNNNLGISVSEGSFYRICRAFSDGAQQLAKLLDCPEEDLITEVDLFFRDTWDKFGKGCRPDTPSPEIDGSYSFRNNVSNASVEVKENSTGSDSNVVVKCASHAPLGVHSQHGKQSLTQISRTRNVSSVSRTESQIVFTNTTSLASSDQNNGLQNISSNEKSQTDMGSSSRSDCLRNEEHVRNLNGRQHSCPELMDVSAEVLSRRRPIIRRGNRGRIGQRNSNPCVWDNYTARFPTGDCLTSGQRRFHLSNAVANSHGTSNSYFGGSGLGSMAFRPYTNPATYRYPLPMNPSRGSHFGIAVPPPVLHDQDPNLGYVYPVIALLHDPSLIYGHPAEQLGYGYPAEHFSGVDVASHDEDPSSVHDHRVHDSEFPSPD